MTLISWLDWYSQRQTIKVDATLTEAHSADADVTEDPTEADMPAVDSVRAKSRTLALEVFISDTYTGSGGLVTEPGRSQTVMGQLETLEREGTRLRIDLGYRNTFGRTYDNMVIRSIKVSRGRNDKASLTISLTFIEIRVVSSEIVAVQKAKEPTQQPKKKSVDVKTSTDPNNAQADSFLYTGLFQ